jgi:hypothetical protein
VPLAAADRQRQCWTFRNRFKDADDGVAAIAGFIHAGGDSSYLVVMTIQRGPPPIVSLSGDIVTVGDRKLRVLNNGLEPLH